MISEKKLVCRFCSLLLPLRELAPFALLSLLVVIIPAAAAAAPPRRSRAADSFPRLRLRLPRLRLPPRLFSLGGCPRGRDRARDGADLHRRDEPAGARPEPHGAERLAGVGRRVRPNKEL